MITRITGTKKKETTTITETKEDKIIKEDNDIKQDTATNDEKKKLAEIDKNGNGKVTIAEAKAAGYKMPIKKEFWLYQYMDDRDGDGMVGE